MSNLILTHKTSRGKQILKECGTHWKILQIEPKIIFTTQLGPWWYICPIKPMDPDKMTSCARWMHSSNDQHLKKK